MVTPNSPPVGSAVDGRGANDVGRRFLPKSGQLCLDKPVNFYIEYPLSMKDTEITTQSGRIHKKAE